MSPALRFHEIEPAQTWPLRQQVLRVGQPLSACRWDGDELPSTHHYAISQDNTVVVIGSLYHRDHALVPGPHAWQLRGMAVAPDQARQGLGSRLLHGMLEACRDHLAGTVIWCNARTTAAAFYEKHAFGVLSDVFEIPGVGPHVVMRRTLPADQPAA